MAKKRKLRKDDGYEQLELFADFDLFEPNSFDDGGKESSDASLAQNTAQVNGIMDISIEQKMHEEEKYHSDDSHEGKSFSRRWISGYKKLLGKFRSDGRDYADGMADGAAGDEEFSKGTTQSLITSLPQAHGIENIRFDIYQNSNRFIDDVYIVSMQDDRAVFSKNGIEMSLPLNDEITLEVNSHFHEGIRNEIEEHISQHYNTSVDTEQFLSFLENDSFEVLTDIIFETVSERKQIYIGDIPIAEYSIDSESVNVQYITSTLDHNLNIIENHSGPSLLLDKTDLGYAFLYHLIEHRNDIQEESVHSVSNYVLDDSDESSLTPRQKYIKNINAIRTLKEIEDNGYVTEEQQHILAQYSGWGGLPQVFDDNNKKWSKERNELIELVSDKEYISFRESTLSAFYTPYIVIDKMYEALNRMGFESGSILEPSCGTGNFIGRMPKNMFSNSHVSGVELDGISSSIAGYLYPDAMIQHCGFENTTFENQTFDLAVTNVPFGQFSVYDRDYAKYNYLIHDYFFMKSLDKVRPGGMVAFITSQSTMEQKNNHVRLELAKKAQFIGAIRLPNNLFKLNGANTEVASDIIFLMKRAEPLNSIDEISLSEDLSWLDVSYFDTYENGEDVYCNDYFLENPDMVIGSMLMEMNQYGHPVLKTRIDDFSELAEKIDTAISSLPEDIYSSVTLESIGESKDTDEVFSVPAEKNIRNHAYFIHDSRLARRYDSVGKYIDSNENHYDRIYRLVEIEDYIQNVFDMQDGFHSDSEFEDALSSLNSAYDDFVKKYGYITSKYNQRIFSDDPNRFMLSALEKTNHNSGTVEKADIFYQRTIKPVEKNVPQNITEAMYYSFNDRGRLDLRYMADVLKRTEEEIRNELLDYRFAFVDPSTDSIVDADSYLSGNIRNKIEIAEEANVDGRFNSNIEALNHILPKDIEIGDIKCQMGSVFIDGEYYKEFICNFFNLSEWARDSISIDFNKLTGEWDFNVPSFINFGTLIRDTWGVPKSDLPYKYSQPDMTGMDLVRHLLSSSIPTCYDYWSEYDGDKEVRKSRVNPERTSIARMKMNEIEREFEDWVVQSYERRQKIQDTYNRMFNSTVNRNYNGDFLTFPDMSKDIELENYQKNAVSRMIFGGNTLLSQVVGAGKTFEMIAASQEMKRVGLCNKPMFVVPNHLVEQWANDFQRLYPRSNILAITTNDFKKNKRKSFINRIAVNNYDAVIIAHSSFSMIPMSRDFELNMLHEEYNNLISILDSTDKQVTIKNLEKAKKRIELQIKRLTDKKVDPDVPLFEKLGVDQLFIDEAHEFKNLYYVTKMSNIAGIQNNGSQKAWDLFMKCQYFRMNDMHVVMATGTPISNSIGELYTFQRYLQYDELESRNIEAFDLWAKTFGEVVNSFEISVDGSGFKNRLRFNKFYNVPELMNIFRGVAEIQTKGMLRKEMENSKIQRAASKAPGYIGDKPQIVVVEPSEELESYIGEIVVRTEKIHDGGVDPRVDNMLKITTDSKKASIDLRLIDESYSHLASGKLKAVSEKIAEIYYEYNDDKATQLIFCDSSAPKEGFNVYDEIRSNLIALGIKEEEIAFIHDAHTDLQKETLFSKVRTGNVRVLIGSTQKMGAGTNVQDRLIAIHHVDVPWRSSDIEQRNGRGFRQGNQYENIYEFRYATKKSFDSYSWQIIENKSTYMQQLLEGTSDSRSIEDDSEMTLSYGEIKAIASGNPLIKEKMELDNEIRQLETEKKFHQKQVFKAEKEIIRLPGLIADTEKTVASMQPVVNAIGSIPEKFDDKDGEWSIEIGGQTYYSFRDANERLLEIEATVSHNETKPAGKYGDFDIVLKDPIQHKCNICIQYQNFEFPLSERVHEIGRVNFDRIHRKIHEVALKVEGKKESISLMKNNLIENKKLAVQPFKNEDRLREALKRQSELTVLLDMERNDNNAVIVEEDTQSDSLMDKINNASNRETAETEDISCSELNCER